MARCAQPFCTGRIEDGYCDVCGVAAGRKGTRPVTRGGQARLRSGRRPRRRTGARPKTRTHGTGTPGTGTTSQRGRLGAGLVEVPRVPYRDPAEAVLKDPVVPEHKRTCGNCESAVGHATKDRPEGRTEGFCPQCGAHFSFTPKLKPGEFVGEQYEVLGCLAHGGVGWIYLARDQLLSGRWVVLKGLLNSGDAEAMSAAAAERRFLASVEHPAIVKIYNFVEHRGSGYIVMEFVGGRSLRDLVLERRRTGGQLPLAQAIAFSIEALRALEYLHEKNLLYCDFKPENIIQTEERMKLIDLGSVRWINDDRSAIWGTVGYQAPEISSTGPSISSDLYTVGRVLAVTSFEFTGFTHTYKNTLPPRDQVGLFQKHESYYRLLRRATHSDPAERFWSAAEMADQLTWVLREVLAAEDGTPRPGDSIYFGPEQRVLGGAVRPDPAVVVRHLPRPLPADSAVYLTGMSSLAPREVLAALDQAPVQSEEVSLFRAQAHLDLGDIARAREILVPLEADWRVDWFLGLAAIADGRFGEARESFDAVYDVLPGEPAVKLALAFCAEYDGDHEQAVRNFKMIWRTDRSYLSAAFGLAHGHLAQGARATAVQVLDSVPATSAHYADAQLTAITALLEAPHPLPVDAAIRVGSLDLEAERRERLTAEVLETALTWTRARPGAAQRGTVFGVTLGERELGFALEETYRRLARMTGDRKERVALVERANSLRPRTLI